VNVDEFPATLWGRAALPATLRVQYQNRGTGGWAVNQQIATTQTARIWVQDGKIMGFGTAAAAAAA
jgi:hypothetical protein